MRKRARRFFFYFLYVAFAMALTTTVVWAFRDLGRCTSRDGSKSISCLCQHPKDKIIRVDNVDYCSECEHYLRPAEYFVLQPEPA